MMSITILNFKFLVDMKRGSETQFYMLVGCFEVKLGEAIEIVLN
jgi:hypothetical protein